MFTLESFNFTKYFMFSNANLHDFQFTPKVATSSKLLLLPQPMHLHHTSLPSLFHQLKRWFLSEALQLTLVWVSLHNTTKALQALVIRLQTKSFVPSSLCNLSRQSHAFKDCNYNSTIRLPFLRRLRNSSFS